MKRSTSRSERRSNPYWTVKSDCLRSSAPLTEFIPSPRSWKRAAQAGNSVIDESLQIARKELADAGREKLSDKELTSVQGAHSKFDVAARRTSEAIGSLKSNLIRATILQTRRATLGTVNPPQYTCTLHCGEFASCLTEQKEAIIGKIGKYNSRRPSDTELRRLLETSSRFFAVFGEALGIPAIGEMLAIEAVSESIPSETGEEFRMAVPVDQVLRTGINFLLLGDAGAGENDNPHEACDRPSGLRQAACVHAPCGPCHIYDRAEPERSRAAYASRGGDLGLPQFARHRAFTSRGVLGKGKRRWCGVPVRRC